MSMTGKGLGRGLDALFNNTQTEQGQPSAPVTTLSTALLEPNPNQPRTNFSDENLVELAASMRSQGVLQPLLVRPGKEAGKYEIIAGERRWRAARLAGLESVPVIMREVDDNEAMIVAMIENIQREDLNPIEEARGFLQIKQALALTQEELAEKVGETRSYLSNSLRLLRLDPETRDEVEKGRLSAGHARCLLSLPTGGDAVTAIRERIIATDMNVRDTEKAVNFWHAENRFPWEKAAEGDLQQAVEESSGKEIKKLAQDIESVLNCRTRISGNSEKGRISLAYESNEQLYDLLEKFGLSTPARSD